MMSLSTNHEIMQALYNASLQMTNRQKFETFTACDLFNLTIQPGLKMTQTFDDSLFAASLCVCYVL